MALNVDFHRAIDEECSDFLKFAGKFIELDSCLVGPRRYQNSEFACFYVLL